MSEHPQALTGPDLRAYSSLRDGCAVFRRDHLRHLEFSGVKAADALNGLVTNNVLLLGVGDGQYAAALTAKGRMVADLRIVRTGDERFLTTTGSVAWSGWHDIVRKYVNPRLARYAERPLHTITVAGLQAARALEQLIERARPGTQPHPIAALRPHAVVTLLADDFEWYVVATPELGEIPAYDVLVPADMLETMLDAISHSGTMTPGTDAAWETARVEAARPLFGPDMNDTTIPQEANLGELDALSFDKGCYTGQETVARVHFRGHVNRHLRQLSSSTPLTVGAQLHSADGKAVGDVRSSVISPSRGPLAIAMVRRELVAGNRVLVDAGDGQSVEAEIVR